MNILYSYVHFIMTTDFSSPFIVLYIHLGFDCSFTLYGMLELKNDVYETTCGDLSVETSWLTIKAWVGGFAGLFYTV
jgi:hypothetical protein